MLSGVGEADLTIDLDSGEYRDPQALTDYVHRLLVASEEPGVTTPYQSVAVTQARGTRLLRSPRRSARRATAGDEGAESFLIGRLLALSVRGRAEPVDITSPGWQSELPAGVAEAFDQDLARLVTTNPSPDLAGGAGLGQRTRAALGKHLGPRGTGAGRTQRLARSSFGSCLITDEDVRWLLRPRGAYVVEDLGPGQTVGATGRFRPARRPPARRAQPRARRRRTSAASVATARARTEKAITDALLDTMPAAGQPAGLGVGPSLPADLPRPARGRRRARDALSPSTRDPDSSP